MNLILNILIIHFFYPNQEFSNLKYQMNNKINRNLILIPLNYIFKIKKNYKEILEKILKILKFLIQIHILLKIKLIF